MVKRSGRYTKKARAKRRRALYRTVGFLVLILIIAGGIYWWRNRPKIDWPISIETAKQTHITLYFPDGTDTFLVPVQRKITLAKLENKHLRALKELRRGPYEDMDNLLPALPAECNFLSVDVHGTTARADFNEKTLDLLNETSEKWFFKSVLHTLSSFDEIQRVEFVFEGRRISGLPHGTDVSQARTPGDINVSFAPLPEGDKEKILLYFPDSSGRYLIPIAEHIPKPGSKAILMLKVMQRLLEGPISVDANYLMPLFKGGVKLKDPGGIVEESGKLTIAFDVGDPVEAASADFERVVTALRLTLEHILDFDEFEITINGEPASELLGLPVSINDLNPKGKPNLLREPSENAVDEDTARGEDGEE